MKPLLLVASGLLLAVLVRAGPEPREVAPLPKKAALQPTVFTAEMTWEEVRAAIKAGKTTVIVATGTTEQNGPHVITGKHNFIVRATAEATARRLGTALVAPVVPFVPEGDIDPPTGHMEYPGTISVRDSTFRALLTDLCSSYRQHGFRNVVLIGDSSGNQTGMKAVAKNLNETWAKDNTRVYSIAEYYEAEWLDDFLAKAGIVEEDEGIHDCYAVSAMLAAVDPKLLRAEQRMAAGKFRINGVPLAPLEKTVAMGRRLIDKYGEVTADAIRKAIKG